MSRFPTGNFFNQDGVRLIEGQDTLPDEDDGKQDNEKQDNEKQDNEKQDNEKQVNGKQVDEDEGNDILEKDFKNIKDASFGFVLNKHIKSKDENSCSYWSTDEAKKKKGGG